MTADMNQPFSAPEERNLTWHRGVVSRSDRQRLLGQKGCVLWLTGLSGSGKSTIAHALDAYLTRRKHLCYVLDGDNIRHGLNADLGFSPGDREENIRRVGEVARLFADAGVIAIAAFISPYRRDRNRVRDICNPGEFIEIHLDVPLNTCEERDPKKLYSKARAGEIQNFTGIDAPYEAPESAEIVLDTSQLAVAACVQQIADYLCAAAIINAKTGEC